MNIINNGRSGSMGEIDCLGEMCPVPVMKLQAVLQAIRRGEPYLLITDHSCTLTNIKEFCKSHGLFCETEEVMNGVWEITVSANK